VKVQHFVLLTRFSFLKCFHQSVFLMLVAAITPKASLFAHLLLLPKTVVYYIVLFTFKITLHLIFL